MILKKENCLEEKTSTSITLPNGSFINEPKLSNSLIDYDGTILHQLDWNSLIYFNQGRNFFKPKHESSSLDYDIVFRLAYYMCRHTNVVLINDEMIQTVYKHCLNVNPKLTWITFSKVFNRLRKKNIISKLERETYMVNPLIFFNLKTPSLHNWVTVEYYEEQQLLRDTMAKHFYDSISKSNEIGREIAKKVVLSLYNDHF